MPTKHKKRKTKRITHKKRHQAHTSFSKLNPDVIKYIKDQVDYLPSIGKNDLIISGSLREKRAYVQRENYKEDMKNKLLEICKFKVYDKEQREKKRQKLIALYKLKLITDCNLLHLEEGEKFDRFNYSGFECVTKELFIWMNDTSKHKVLDDMIEYAVERDPTEVYFHLYDYHEDIYKGKNWEEYEQPPYDDEDEDNPWEPPQYKAPFEKSDKQALKKYLKNLINDTCYGNINGLVMCSITDHIIMPFLSVKDRIKIIDYMLELSVRKNNIPEICNYLLLQFN